MKKIINRETILYLVFGILTTVVNYGVFYIGLRLLGEKYTLLINIVCFIAASTFAYVTNKMFVFESKSWSLRVLKTEVPAFFGARIFSFLLEEAGLWLFTFPLHAGRYQFFGVNGVMIAKIALSLAVVLLNYFFSKLFIFKKSNEESHESTDHHSGLQ